METILTMISTVGFPIVAVLGCAWFIYQFWNRNQTDMINQMNALAENCQRREDKLYTQLDKFSDSLNSFNATLASIDARLEVIERAQFCGESKHQNS